MKSEERNGRRLAVALLSPKLPPKGMGQSRLDVDVKGRSCLLLLICHFVVPARNGRQSVFGGKQPAFFCSQPFFFFPCSFLLLCSSTDVPFGQSSTPLPSFLPSLPFPPFLPLSLSFTHTHTHTRPVFSSSPVPSYTLCVSVGL